MRKRLQKSTAGIITIGVVIAAILLWIPSYTFACGWGGSGGQGYVPKRQGPSQWTDAKNSLSKEQALEIVTSHVQRLNPSLKIGEINDAGAFYEADVLSEDNEIVQILGVDKYSGRLMLIN